MNRLFQKDSFLMILSLAIAIFVWAVVMDSDNPYNEFEFTNIPVQLTNGEERLQNEGLTILEGNSLKVNVRVSGRRNDIIAVDTREFDVEVDLSSIKEAGSYTLPVSVNLNNSAISLLSTRPNTAVILVDKMVTSTIPVQIKTSGAAEEGYICQEATASPTQITISGPQSEVNQIAAAVATVALSDANKDFEATVRLALVDKDGNIVETKYTTKGVETVQAQVKIRTVKTAQLEVATTGTLNNLLNISSMSIEPSGIAVWGNDTVINNLDNIQVGPLDLSTVTESTTEVVLPIQYPDGVRPQDMTQQTCKVTITVTRKQTKTVTVSDLQLRNVSAQNNAQITDTSLAVVVAGEAVDLDRLDESTITATVDLENERLVPGTYQMDATLTLPDGSNVTAIGDYKVWITVS